MSIGDFGPSPGGGTSVPLEGTQQTQGLEQVQAPPAQPGAYNASQSTLANSIAEAIINTPNAAIPFLIPPGMSFNQFFQSLSQGTNSNAQGDVSVIQGAILLEVARVESEVISEILDKWNESIKEQVKRAEEKALAEVTINLTQNTARSGAEYEEWLNSLPPQTKAEVVEISKNGNLQSWLIEGISSYMSGLPSADQLSTAATTSSSSAPISSPAVDNTSAIINPLATSSYGMMPLVTGALIVGINLPALSATDPVAAKQMASNPYQDAFTSITPAAGLAADYTAAAAMIAALIGRAVSYTSPFETLDKAGAAGGTAPHNIDFAKDYADSMVALVSGPGFNNFVMAMVIQKMDNAQALNPDQRADLLNSTKTVLLATALVLLYRAYMGGEAERGGVSGDEFLALLQNPIKDLFPDMPEELQNTFQKTADALIASLPQDGGMAENVMNALAGYIDTRPKVDELLDVAEVFRGLQDQLPATTRPVAAPA